MLSVQDVHTYYGDSYIPHIKQEEPLKAECQHFLDCIEKGTKPLTGGHEGLELVRAQTQSAARTWPRS